MPAKEITWFQAQPEDTLRKLREYHESQQKETNKSEHRNQTRPRVPHHKQNRYQDNQKLRTEGTTQPPKFRLDDLLKACNVKEISELERKHTQKGGPYLDYMRPFCKKCGFPKASHKDNAFNTQCQSQSVKQQFKPVVEHVNNLYTRKATTHTKTTKQ